MAQLTRIPGESRNIMVESPREAWLHPSGWSRGEKTHREQYKCGRKESNQQTEYYSTWNSLKKTVAWLLKLKILLLQLSQKSKILTQTDPGSDQFNKLTEGTNWQVQTDIWKINSVCRWLRWSRKYHNSIWAKTAF
jgi:hypothetical protein